MRSERREACGELLAGLIHFSKLDRPIVDVPLALVAEKIGLSMSRIERAYADLSRAKIIQTVRRRCRRETGDDGKQRIRGMGAIRRWHRGFFAALSVPKLWERMQQRRSPSRTERGRALLENESLAPANRDRLERRARGGRSPPVAQNALRSVFDILKTPEK